MTRDDLQIHNAWCAFAASEGFAGLVEAMCARLSKTLGTPVELRTAVVAVVESARIEKLFAAGQFAFAIEAGAGKRAVAVASRLLPARMLKLLSGSDKLSVSHSFCRAAIELLLLDAAAAISETTGTNILVSPAPSGAAFDADAFVQLRVAVRIGEPAGDLALFVPARLPPAGDRFPAFLRRIRIPANAGLEIEPLEVERLEGSMPGDVLNLSAAGTGPRAVLRLELGRETAREYRIDLDTFLNDGTIKIDGGPMEATMAEVDTKSASDARMGTNPVSTGRFRLPVRLEILAFEIPAADLEKLAPGQVLETKAEPGRAVKMYVCGELFAQGHLEHLEGFDGFRIEKIF
ncbi:MAG: FliM/FliN family flagellar motor switch protein [Deltaproteobacteria bacterium]|nr:FliM/FliN family flagellar motor switch protein [Deltaproteobacteria bacterium]